MFLPFSITNNVTPNFCARFSLDFYLISYKGKNEIAWTFDNYIHLYHWPSFTQGFIVLFSPNKAQVFLFLLLLEVCTDMNQNCFFLRYFLYINFKSYPKFPYTHFPPCSPTHPLSILGPGIPPILEDTEFAILRVLSS